LTFAFTILAVLASGASIFAYTKGDGSHVRGFRIAGSTFVNMLPLLFMAFLLAGFMQVVIPPELIRSWLGGEAGLRGVLIGCLVGILIPGGPYIAFPIIASIYNAGAGLGPVIACITAWAMWGSVTKIVFEITLIGYWFTVLRLCLVLLFPPFAGMIAAVFF